MVSSLHHVLQLHLTNAYVLDVFSLPPLLSSILRALTSTIAYVLDELSPAAAAQHHTVHAAEGPPGSHTLLRTP